MQPFRLFNVFAIVICIVCLDRVEARSLQGIPRSRTYLDGWKLLWRDEFNGNRLNTKYWGYQKGDGCEYGICGWGNGELQYYTNFTSNVDVEGGHLIIKARHETGGDRERLQRFCKSRCSDSNCKKNCDNVEFSSGRIRTAGKFSIGPGSRGFDTIRISIKLKVSPGESLWSAIWMLPELPSNRKCSGCGRYGGWARSGELDIFEAVNGMTSALGTIHYGDTWPNNQYAGSQTVFDPNQWHVATLIWRKTKMEWYIDGAKYGEQRSGGGTRNGWFSAGQGAGPNAPFDTKFHLLLNTAIGGGLTGNIPPQAAAVTLQEPKAMHIDWIRVYGRKD